MPPHHEFPAYAPDALRELVGNGHVPCATVCVDFAALAQSNLHGVRKAIACTLAHELKIRGCGAATFSKLIPSSTWTKSRCLACVMSTKRPHVADRLFRANMPLHCHAPADLLMITAARRRGTGVCCSTAGSGVLTGGTLACGVMSWRSPRLWGEHPRRSPCLHGEHPRASPLG